MGLVVVAGCSAAPHPAAAPTGARPHATIDEAERDLARAEAELPAAPAVGGMSQPTGAAQPYAQRPKDQAPSAPPAPVSEAAAKPAAKAAAPRPDAEKTDADKKPRDRSQTDADEAPTPCQTACRALASMQRAAESVCRLAGESDARCDGAKKRVESARARVSHCGCQ